MAGQIQNTVECPVAKKMFYFLKYIQKMLTTACPASGQKKKEGLGLDVEGGEVEVRITHWCCQMKNQADRQNTERNHRNVKGKDSM